MRGMNYLQRGYWSYAFHPTMGLLWDRGTKVCKNDPAHTTKMAAMPIYGKKPLKIFFSGTKKPMTLKLGMQHRVARSSVVSVNLMFIKHLLMKDNPGLLVIHS